MPRPSWGQGHLLRRQGCQQEAQQEDSQLEQLHQEFVGGGQVPCQELALVPHHEVLGYVTPISSLLIADTTISTEVHGFLQHQFHRFTRQA